MKSEVKGTATSKRLGNTGLDNKLYKMYGTYIILDVNNFDVRPMLCYVIL